MALIVNTQKGRKIDEVARFDDEDTEAAMASWLDTLSNVSADTAVWLIATEEVEEDD